MKTNIILPAEIVGEKINIQKITILVLVLLLSIILIFYVHTSDLESASTANMLIGSSGYIGLIGVCLSMFTKKKYIIYAPTGSKIITKTIEFSESDYQRVQSLVQNRATEQLSTITKTDGVSMYLDIVYSKDKQFAAYQFFKYVPYEYISASELCFIDGKEVEKFCI